MSILIKGLKMPQYCAHCELFHDEGFCTATGTHVNMWGQKRNADCPLIELPDHGDLIDRDEFVAEKREQFCADCYKRKSLKTGRFVYEIGDCVCRACDTDDMLDYIEEAPVVIPAERCEE